MSLKQKIIASSILIGLVVIFIAGISLTASHEALGTFLFSSALMLSPFVGLWLIAAALYITASTLDRTLFAASGALIVAAIIYAVFAPLGVIPLAALPLYIIGTALGVGAVCLVKPYARFTGPLSQLMPRAVTVE